MWTIQYSNQNSIQPTCHDNTVSYNIMIPQIVSNTHYHSKKYILISEMVNKKWRRGEIHSSMFLILLYYYYLLTNQSKFLKQWSGHHRKATIDGIKTILKPATIKEMLECHNNSIQHCYTTVILVLILKTKLALVNSF